MTTTLQPNQHHTNHAEHLALHPTDQARRLHLSHLATTHRAPLVPGRKSAGRTHASSFTAMARDPLAGETTAGLQRPNEPFREHRPTY